jgi:3-oxoacyl-[acyl-carrier-protein] synthase III
MYLAGVACALPAQRISNGEILDLVSYYSRGIYAGDLAALISLIDAKLRRAGIRSRYWRSSKERPIALLQRACEAAMKESKVATGEVDFVIYVGVDRGFAEPANACFVAKELGMNRARTFDVTDACLGWTTATEITQALFASAPESVALVVSAEFPMRLNGAVLPECFSIASDEELDWKFPALTLGEAATASVLFGEGPPWRYVHESLNEFADLCTVGLGPAAEYAGPSARFGAGANSGFRAYGNDLGRQAYRPAVRVLQELLSRIGTPRVVFPHSVVGPYIEQVVARVSPELRVFSTFTEMGNLATSSLPSCIARARKQGIVSVTDIPVGWVAASGLKVSAFEIVQGLR